MRRKGLRAFYRKPRTTVPGEPSKRCHCLMDLKHVRAVDQVWTFDITCVPLQKGFSDLVAIVDLFIRNVLSWKLSNSLVREFCLEALEMALQDKHKPEILHSYQGCQFTSGSWPSCRQKRSRSAGQAGNVATTTSWSFDSRESYIIFSSSGHSENRSSWS